MSKPSDDELEKRIVKIMSLPNHYDYPEPQWVMNEYGYKNAVCPKCGAKCLRLGGYHQHYTVKHVPNNNRQKAKRIIKTLRKEFRQEGKIELAVEIERKVRLALQGVHAPGVLVMPWEQIARPILYKLLPRSKQ